MQVNVYIQAEAEAKAGLNNPVYTFIYICNFVEDMSLVHLLDYFCSISYTNNIVLDSGFIHFYVQPADLRADVVDSAPSWQTGFNLFT
jgi:hypothetical protein